MLAVRLAQPDWMDASMSVVHNNFRRAPVLMTNVSAVRNDVCHRNGTVTAIAIERVYLVTTIVAQTIDVSVM
jgi:hypothetical protein